MLTRSVYYLRISILPRILLAYQNKVNAISAFRFLPSIVIDHQISTETTSLIDGILNNINQEDFDDINIEQYFIELDNSN